MSFLVNSAVAQTAAAPAQPAGFGDPVFLIMMVGMFAFMYFFIIRPQRKRQKEHQNLVSALTKGDEVVLTSGLLGKIVKVELKFQKVAVHAVLPKGTIKSIDAA